MKDSQSFAAQASLALILAAGCGTTVTARIARPAPGQRPSPIVLAAPSEPVDEAVTGVPPGALTSQAALAKLEQGTVCADLVLRTWWGTPEEWSATLSVDGRDAGATQFNPYACRRLRAACLPLDSLLEDEREDANHRVKVGAGRLCFAVPAQPARTVEMDVSQGAYHLRFRWELDEGQPSHGPG